jgi:cell division protein FtsB
MKKKPVRTNLIIRTAFTLIFIFLLVSVINLQVEMNELRKDRDARLEQVQQLQDSIDELELRIAEPIDDEYIERVARELGYRKPNEVIYRNNIPE